jgi:hypothetical protein
MLDFDGISIGHAQGQDVQKIHFCLDVSMQTIIVLEHHMSLRIVDVDYLGFFSLMSTLEESSVANSGPKFV